MSQPADPTPAARAIGLTKAFDGDPVVAGVDLDITEGTIVGIIGPSGSGKTTTVRMLVGLLAPTSGTAEVLGGPAIELTPRERSRLGYLPQIPALFPDLSIWENLSFHASMYGLPFRRRQLRPLLEWVELLDHRRTLVRNASGGMQRRLALAAAVVHAPELIFLDEPTAGIDPILREGFWEEFRALVAGGRTIVVTTQYVSEAAYCDAVGLLSDGELLLFDTPDNLRRAAYDGEVIDVRLRRPATDDEIARLAAEPFVTGTVERERHDVLRLVVADADDALVQLGPSLDAAGLELIEATSHNVEHDEAFVRIVERHRRSTGGEGSDTSSATGATTGAAPGTAG